MIAKRTRSRAGRRYSLMALITLVALLLPAIPAQAIGPIANTQEDLDPNPAFPIVAGGWRPFNDTLDPNTGQLDRVRATGFLIAPNVLITERNSYQNGQKVLVSFQSPITDFTDDPEDRLYPGYLFQYPKPRKGSEKDIAVIILDKNVEEFTPDDFAKLAPIGTLDNAIANNPTPLTLVSFGPHDSASPESSDLKRRFTQATLASLTSSDASLDLLDGTYTCFGDTGGPIVGASGVVALIKGWGGMCGDENTDPTTGTAFGYRLDTQDAYQFLCDVSSDSFSPKVKNPNPTPEKIVPYHPVSAGLEGYCGSGGTQSRDHHHKDKHQHGRQHHGTHRH